jgi:hypothetical protein
MANKRRSSSSRTVGKKTKRNSNARTDRIWKLNEVVVKMVSNFTRPKYPIIIDMRDDNKIFTTQFDTEEELLEHYESDEEYHESSDSESGDNSSSEGSSDEEPPLKRVITRRRTFKPLSPDHEDVLEEIKTDQLEPKTAVESQVDEKESEKILKQTPTVVPTNENLFTSSQIPEGDSF